MAKDNRIHILQMTARNVKGVREVAVDFEGNVHEIRGDSGQGKTTIIQSIRGALEGLDRSMVRNGADSAEINLVLSEATIKRITPSDKEENEVLMVTGGDGKALEKAKAKALLAMICGQGVFNPVRWVQLGNSEETKGRTERLREQRKQLLEALPLTLTENDVWAAVESLGEPYVAAMEEVNTDGVDLEKQHPFVACMALHEACYGFRKLKNQQAEDAENRLKLAPAPERMAPNMPLAECEALVQAAEQAYYRSKGTMDNRGKREQELTRLRGLVASEAETLPARKDVEATAAKYANLKTTLAAEVAALEAQLVQKKRELEAASEKADKAETLMQRWRSQDARLLDLQDMEAELSGGVEIDLGALEYAVNDARANREARKLQDAHDTAAKVAAEAKATAEIFTGLVKLFRDDLPKALLAKANLGIEGLGVDEDKITINGVPLHQLGTSQQIRIGVMVAAAVNPQSGFVLVDGAESMGGKDRRALAEAAQSMGLQLIMTIVDDDPALLAQGSGPGLTVMDKFQKVEAA